MTEVIRFAEKDRNHVKEEPVTREIHVVLAGATELVKLWTGPRLLMGV